MIVKMHMRGICKRLNASNRTQAAVIGLREELV
jgi:DNA-binding CsgD family transcriptional regulator